MRILRASSGSPLAELQWTPLPISSPASLHSGLQRAFLNDPELRVHRSCSRNYRRGFICPTVGIHRSYSRNYRRGFIGPTVGIHRSYSRNYRRGFIGPTVGIHRSYSRNYRRFLRISYRRVGENPTKTGVARCVAAFSSSSPAAIVMANQP